MRVLIVEDEKKLANIVARSFVDEGLAVDVAESIEQGIGLTASFPYDLVILDLLLPDGSGTTLLRYIRMRRLDVPVLVLTARDQLETKIANFDAGADDYLTKPFSLAELTSRVRALLRRRSGINETVLHMADLELDRIGRRVRRGGRNIDLSPKEFALLEHLLLNAGRVLTRSMIIDGVWDQTFEGLTNIVDVYVRQLRRKIDDGREPKLIRTVRGIGYAIDADCAS